MIVPTLLHTQRLVLRPWRVSDASALGEILDVNYAHLGPWIPPRIATPAPPDALEARVQKFADDFEGANEWRYAMFASADDTLLGEISVFPRSPTARVPYSQADRVEIGYWIRKDRTGKGFVTEAVRSVLDMITRDRRFVCVEIRCDPRNEPSNAIPRALGFTLAEEGELSVWRKS